MKSFFDNLPEIISRAGTSALTLIALISIIICVAIVVLFRKEQNGKIRLIAFFCFLVTFVFVVFQLLSINGEINDEIKFDAAVTTQKPKVIGIYPSDHFGPYQKKGLTSAIGHYSNDLDVINLDFVSLADMKLGKIDQLIDSIKYYLENENILAISGPPVTECTKKILSAIKSTKSKVPIFISTAASKSYLQWSQYRKSINLYRISSGIDERAKSLAKFFRTHTRAITMNNRTAVLVEKNSGTKSKTYGELFLERIIDESPDFSNYQDEGIVEVFYFDKKDGLASFDQLFDEIKSNYKTVFLMSAGKEFEHAVKKYYTGNYPSNELPKLGGWMFGYAMNSFIKKTPSGILNNKIFEITDMNISRSDLSISQNFAFFKAKFGGFHPGLRDECFSFDAGVCIAEAYRATQEAVNISPDEYIKFDLTALNYFNRMIAKPENPFDGVSKEIVFSNGFDRQLEMHCAIFDSTESNWRTLSNIELLKL